MLRRSALILLLLLIPWSVHETTAPDQKVTAQSAEQPQAATLQQFDEPLLNALDHFPFPPTTTTTLYKPRTVAPAPKVQTTQQTASSGAGDPYNDASWDRLAQCESGGRWNLSTGNGYFGGLQFSLSSWRGVGGTGYPHEASKAEQIHRGQLLWEQGGWRHWPACTRSFGWR